jgi:hypothetical protein
MIAFIVNPCVVGVIVGRKHTMFDERADTGCSKRLAETHGIVALVGSEALQVACVPQGNLRPNTHPDRPFGATVQVDNRFFSRVNLECRLNRSDGVSGPVEVVSRCLLAVEVGGIDGGWPLWSSSSAERRSNCRQTLIGARLNALQGSMERETLLGAVRASIGHVSSLLPNR